MSIDIKLSLLFCYFVEHYSKVEQYMKISDWYVWVHMDKGQVTMPVFQSLDAYWPGLQVIHLKALCIVDTIQCSDHLTVNNNISPHYRFKKMKQWKII